MFLVNGAGPSCPVRATKTHAHVGQNDTKALRLRLVHNTFTTSSKPGRDFPGFPTDACIRVFTSQRGAPVK